MVGESKQLKGILREMRGLLSYRRLAEMEGVSHSTLYRRANPESEVKRIDRVRATRVFTTINGKTASYKVKKRPRPQTCEICNRGCGKRLYWHHWNDEHLEWGLWLCWLCHRGAEFSENGKFTKYLELKKKYPE